MWVIFGLAPTKDVADTPVTLHVSGLLACDYSLLWEDIVDNQLRRTYNDEQSVTERAAIAVSVMHDLKCLVSCVRTLETP